MLFLFISLTLSGATYYVTTTGSNSNSGTSIGTAWATWQYGMTHVNAGDILYIRAGTYIVMYSSNYGVSINSTSGRGSNGTAGSHILVSAYPGDANPVLDCSGLTGGGEHDGVLIENTQYWDFTGLTVINTKARGSGQPAPGWTLSNCSHITLNQCILHDNDNGFVSYWGNDVHYINCDSYHNGETSLYFGNNGFYGCVKGGGTTYWYGCRSYLNGQDGFDSFAQNGGDGFLYWDKCWAFSNATWYGASSGFKQGLSGVAPTTTNPMRILTNCIAADMPCGYDESQDPEAEKHAYSYPHAMYNCISYGNDVAFAFDVAGGIDGKENTDIIKNCISYSDKYVSYIGFGHNTVDHNSWNIRTMTSGDFQSTDISQLSASRQADGSLPVMTFLHLTTSASPFIDAGADVGLAYAGKGPDIGAFEMQAGSTSTITLNMHPIVMISNPRKGNIFENLTTITIDAIASDPDGTVTKVEFFNGAVRLVELTAAPYSFIWKDVSTGSHSITAKATDNLNDSTISAPVEFVVGAKVKYDANSDIIKLYPNPNDGHFSIAFINPLQNEKSDIVITDLAGKQVYNGPVLKEETLKQFDLSGSKSGIYIMMIKDKEILVAKKFIKK